ncbi:MAG: nucleotide exchange factor GrpE [Clostridia bacterium]|nr:nucleotide exchange factor GrpE [Clostridia bacterium]
MANTDKEQEVVETAENTAEETADAAESKTAELEKELAASKEAHIRTLAEYDNYRKRTAKEKENTWVDAKAVCITELLPMLDNFDRALGVTDSDFESYKKGVEMIYQGFCETLKKLGVEAFGEEGDEFDPNFHSAVMHVDDESLGENVLAQVFSKGYKLGEKVLRPAMVKVAN